MRKAILALLLALCFCLTAACGAEDVLGTADAGAPADETQQEAPDLASETDAANAGQEAGSLEGSDAGSDTDALPPEGEDTESAGLPFADLTEEQCVSDALEEPGVLPRVTLDCPGAEAINESVMGQFSQEAADPNWTIHYETFKAEDILSVLVVEQAANDCTYYTPYVLDLSTGQALTGQELLEKMGLDGDALADKEVQVLAEEFDHRFGDIQAQTDQAFYDGQRERTTDLENCELERLWLDGDGQLRFVGRIYSMAGAEYYEYPLASGLYLG